MTSHQSLPTAVLYFSCSSVLSGSLQLTGTLVVGAALACVMSYSHTVPEIVQCTSSSQRCPHCPSTFVQESWQGFSHTFYSSQQWIERSVLAYHKQAYHQHNTEHIAWSMGVKFRSALQRFIPSFNITLQKRRFHSAGARFSPYIAFFNLQRKSSKPGSHRQRTSRLGPFRLGSIHKWPVLLLQSLQSSKPSHKDSRVHCWFLLESNALLTWNLESLRTHQSYDVIPIHVS